MTILTLSRDIGQVQGLPLTPDLTIGPDAGFGDIADILPLPGGGFAVLDRLLKEVRLYSREGQFTRPLGREGDGPGEFRVPLSAASHPNGLTVWDPWSVRFTTFDWSGTVFQARGMEIPGDAPTLRSRTDWDNLDLSGRLQAFHADTLLYETWDSEFDQAARERGLKSRLIIVLESLSMTDTVHVFSETLPAQYAGEYSMGFELFTPLPHWSASESWLATAEGNAPEVHVLKGGQLRTVVRWPAADHYISDEDKERAALALFELQKPFLRESARERWTPDKLREMGRSVPTPAIAPEVMGVHLVGDCLWFAGFSSDGQYDGTSHSWVAVDLEDAKVAGVYRLGGPTAKVRSFSGTATYVEVTGETGDWVYRYPLTDACSQD